MIAPCEVEILQCKAKVKLHVADTLIKLVGKTDYSHYALRFKDTKGRWVYVDATLRCVSPYNEETFSKHYDIHKVFHTSVQGGVDEMLDFLYPLWGRPYSPLQVVGLGVKIILGKMFWPIRNLVTFKNPFKDGKEAIICNELVILFLSRFFGADINLEDELNLSETESLIVKVLERSRGL